MLWSYLHAEHYSFKYNWYKLVFCPVSVTFATYYL